MKILLIQPKMNKRPMDTDLKIKMSPPMALYTILRLTPPVHQVKIVNENIEEIDYGYDCDLVGITVTLDVMPRACKIAKEFRQRGVSVVAGGIHITCCPQDCSPHFDAICVGAAERAWGKILKDAPMGRLERVYHDMDGFAGSELASPRYEAMDNANYLLTNVVTTSRGCPNRCDFCYNSCRNRNYVCRPVQDVLRDIKTLKTNHVFFIDDNFIGNVKYAYELLGHMKRIGLTWSAAVTTKIIEHTNLLDLMMETGCQSLFIGLESLSRRSLGGVHKDNDVAKYEKLIEAIHKRGIMVNASMVFGFDEDEPDVFPKTLDWLVKNKVETLTSHILTPYPGTELYKRMNIEGRIINKDLSCYNTAHVVFEPKKMSRQELYQGYLWMYRQFYSFKNIVRRIPKNKKQWNAYFLFNFIYRKFGKGTSAIAKMIPMHKIGRLITKIAYPA